MINNPYSHGAMGRQETTLRRMIIILQTASSTPAANLIGVNIAIVLFTYVGSVVRPKLPSIRRDKGRAGGTKMQHDGYMHFCKGLCFAKHKCGHVRYRRSKGTVGVRNDD